MLTPQRAVDKLGPEGGTVELGRGTYTNQRIVLVNKRNVTIHSSGGAVLDGRGLDIKAKQDLGLVEVQNGSNITIDGLTITGFRTRIAQATPMGIFASGAVDGLTIRKNHVTKLGNDNPGGEKDEKGKKIQMNAHGIAIYGNAANPMKSVTVADNEVDHLVLGASESVVFNGNVDGYKATGNNVHDNNNIGIDAIGSERTNSGPNNRARNGVISNNKVSRIVSEGNPAYEKGCDCADGIYLDGAADTVVENNTVTDGDIGIEVASEAEGGEVYGVKVRSNTISGNRSAGISVGGYEADLGEAYDVTITGNILRKNNTRNHNAEIHIQHKVHDSVVSDNSITVGGRQSPAVYRVAPVGGVPEDTPTGNPVPTSTASPTDEDTIPTVTPRPSDEDTIPTVTPRPSDDDTIPTVTPRPSDDDTIPTVTSRPRNSGPDTRSGAPAVSGGEKERNLVFRNNKYSGAPFQLALFHWQGRKILGFAAWQAIGQDKGGTWGG